QVLPPASYGVVFEVAPGGGAAAARPGAGSVPDLGQVPELDPRVVAVGLQSVVAGVGGDRGEIDDQVRPVCRVAQSPGVVAAGRAVSAGRDEAESGPARRWPRPSGVAMSPGSGPGAAVPDGVALLVGHGDTPGGLRVARGSGGQVAGQPR